MLMSTIFSHFRQISLHFPRNSVFVHDPLFFGIVVLLVVDLDSLWLRLLQFSGKMSNDSTKMKEEEEEENEEMEDEQEEEEEDEEGGSGADHRCQLFVRFPCTVPPKDEIKALHPDIIKVLQKKQRKPKFCHLVFSSPEKARKAKEELSSTPYKNMGHLNVQFKDDPGRYRRGGGLTRGDQKKKWLVIYGIPPTEPDANVREELQRYGCTHAHVYRKDINNVLKKGSAKLIFNTPMDSEAFINNKELHVYKGSPIEVKYLKTGPTKGEKKSQRRRERRKEYEERLKNANAF